MVSTNHPLLRVGITFACTFPPPLDCPHLLLHLQDSSEHVVGDHAPPPPSNIAAPDRTTASTVSWRHGEPTTHPPCPASHPWHASAFFILLAVARPLVSPHRPCHHGHAVHGDRALGAHDVPRSRDASTVFGRGRSAPAILAFELATWCGLPARGSCGHGPFAAQHYSSVYPNSELVFQFEIPGNPFKILKFVENCLNIRKIKLHFFRILLSRSMH
jgi:hypothetical protein